MDKLKELKEELAKIGKLSSTLALIEWDMQTKMPKKAVEQRSAMIEYISGEIFALKTSYVMGNLINELWKYKGKLSKEDKAIVRIAKREYESTKKISEPRYRAYILASALSQNAWVEAKEKKDFEIFKPHLKKMVDFKKEFAEYWGYGDNRYDALLDNFEEGLKVKTLDKIFKELRDGVVELLKDINNSKVEINNEFLYGNFNKDTQEKFSKFILEKMGFDFEAGRIDESMHPFTTDFGNKDVRVTTNYGKAEISDTLFSSIHEGGHAIYEQDIPDEFLWTGLDTAPSMGMHESQSRFYENILGRSKDFWEYFLPYLQYQFKEFRTIGLDDFYKAINKVTPSLIRTEADELTYNLHIIIRYEVEKALIDDDLDIDEVKDLWNDKYEEYLGLRPKNDSEGILQDIHWSDGSFGYFPTYALGNLYGAQMLKVLEKDYCNYDEDIKRGDLEGIHNWLRGNVHKYGAIYSPGELIELISNEPLKTKYFLEYLNKKYRAIYNIK